MNKTNFDILIVLSIIYYICMNTLVMFILGQWQPCVQKVFAHKKDFQV